MLVLAIDVGIKNLALCAMGTSKGTLEAGVYFWANEPLASTAYKPMHNVKYVHEFIHAHESLFDRADLIIIERQMRANMRIIEAVIHSRFFDKCKVVHARTVKGAFGLGRGNYALNKKAAVDFVEAHLAVHGEAHARTLFAQSKKRDDLADAYVMALFFSGGSKISGPCTILSQARSAALTHSESSTAANSCPCGSVSGPIAELL